MKRIIALLLVCLTLVQMLPLGIHAHAQEGETAPAETLEAVETAPAATETEPAGETVPVIPETVPATTPETIPETIPETTPETVPAATETEPTGETAPETTPETTPETVETEPLGETLPSEESNYQLILDGILNTPVEEMDEMSAGEHPITPSSITTKGVNDHKYNESESNNDWSLADLIENDYTVIASVGGYDTDFFAMRLNYKSEVTIITVAKKSTFGMGFYDASQNLLTKDIKGSKTDDGNYSYTITGKYSAGKYYYVTLDSAQSSSYNYIFYVEIEPLYKTCKHSSKKKVETVEPTCGADGYTSYYCKTCEYTFKDKIVPATGDHIYDDEFDSYCNVCNYYRSVGIASGTCGSNLRWVLSESGVLTIMGTGSMYNYASGTNPAPWDDYRYQIEKVDIREGVTSVGDYAFYFSDVEQVDFPSTLTHLGDGAFAFSSVKRIALPASFRTLYAATFQGCRDLEEFQVDSENPYFCNDVMGVLFNKDKTTLYLAPPTLEGSYTIPDTVKEISVLAFQYSGLSRITIPQSVTTISAGAFYYCSELKEIVIPDGVTSIGDTAFCGCTSLSQVQLSQNLYSIGENAFTDCTEITKITFPKMLSNIKAQAFWGCTNLREITFEGSAPTIGSYAFYYVSATVYYPITNTTWNSSTKQSYGGTLTWVGKCIGGHAEVIDTPGYAPTCLEEGLSPDSHCSNCGEITSVQQVLPALGHAVVVDAYRAPTCLNTGLTEGSHCSRCHVTLVARTEIPALGHDRVTDDYVAPLCEETGLTEGSHCSRCGEIFVAQNVIPALGHSYTNHWCDHCGRAEFVEVTSIETDKLALNAGEQAYLTAVLDYPIRPETEIVWSLAEGDGAYVTLEPSGTTAILTAKGVLEERTVTVYARTADGLTPAAQLTMTLRAMPADQILYAGKSLTLKPIDPATGKAYAAKALNWSLSEEYEPFVTMKNGKVTARKVVEKARVEVVATVKATGERIAYVLDIYPAVTQVEVTQDGDIVNGKTLFMDYTDGPLTLQVDTYPLDTLETVTWTISDKKGQYADYIVDGDRLTIENPKGSSGTVTIKATVDAGTKKTATVKVSFGSFAKEVKLTALGDTTLRGGQSLSLSAYVSKPVVVTKPGIVWSVSDKTAASVSGGKVTAKNVASPTTVTVTATSKDGQAKADIQLTILPKNEGQLVIMEDGTYITNTTKAMNYGQTLELAAFTIENGQPVTAQVTWSSNKTSVAYVSGGEVTAVGMGTAKLTAETADGRKAVVNIKVTTLVSNMKITTKDGKNLDAEGNVVMASGKSVTLMADILTQGANKAVTWEMTEGAEYAKLSTSGKLTANTDLTKPVTAAVKATAKDGSGMSSTILVRILPLATGVQIFESGSRVRSNTAYVCDMLQTPTIRLSARVYPAGAGQAVQLTSSNTKIAAFNDQGELECLKPGTVTITAAATDGSGVKTTFKLTIVKRITDLRLKDGLAVDENGDLFVAGGKSLKLADCVEISPSDATNKKLTWSVADNDAGIKISAAGVLTTKKVSRPVTVNVMAIAQDGSGQMVSFNVTVYPA